MVLFFISCKCLEISLYKLYILFTFFGNLFKSRFRDLYKFKWNNFISLSFDKFIFDISILFPIIGYSYVSFKELFLSSDNGSINDSLSYTRNGYVILYNRLII